jgi:hypothetical protein
VTAFLENPVSHVAAAVDRHRTGLVVAVRRTVGVSQSRVPSAPHTWPYNNHTAIPRSTFQEYPVRPRCHCRPRPSPPRRGRYRAIVAFLPKHRPIRAGILDGQHVSPGDAIIGGTGDNHVARRVAYNCERLIGRVADDIIVALPRPGHGGPGWMGGPIGAAAPASSRTSQTPPRWRASNETEMD